jgi:hypothetical protein
MLKRLQSGANALGKGEVDSSILSGSTSQVAIPSRLVVDLQHIAQGEAHVEPGRRSTR